MTRYKLKQIGEIVSGATPKTNDPSNFDGDIAWITPADLSGYDKMYISEGARSITTKGYESCSAKLLPAGSVLFSSRAPIGYVAIASNPVCTNQGFKSIIPNSNVNPEFLYYQLKYLRKTIESMGTGTTFREISGKRLGEVDIVLPNIEEQTRIVERIEELFSQLDNGVETLKKTKQQLAVYRQAVLKDAFDDLTATCPTATIRSACEDIKVGIVIKPTQYYVSSDGVPAFRNANVRRNFIEDTDWAMISQEGHRQNKRSEVHTNDVLIARSGANLGMCAVVTEQYDGYNAIDVVIAVPNQQLIRPQYLAYYTNSPYGISSIKANQHGAAQGHINVTEYGKLPIFLPDLTAQDTVIAEIDERLSLCDGIEKTVETALQQAEAMRQSILKQAFEGRL